MVLIAHLTDPHIGPLPRPRLRELASKRLTGYINWRRGRSATHDMGALSAILADMQAHEPDHIAFTGDIVNIGLAAEFPVAREFITRLGAPERVSFVPGNHDAYVRASMLPLSRSLGPWMASDGSVTSEFPFVRRREGIAIVGVTSAVPTLPFMASGRIGRRQAARLMELLGALRDEGLCRVVLIHHPPYRGGASAGRGLSDAAHFEAVIRRAGAELVLHGHNHRTSVAHLRGPNGPVPVVGAPSASAIGGTRTHRAAYHLFAIAPDGTRSKITARARGLLVDGASIGDLDAISLEAK